MLPRVRLSIGAGLAAAFVCAIALPLHAQTLIPRTTERPSFDCTKARAPIELLICADAELAQWDGRLGHAYNGKARQLADDDRKALLQEQRQWAAFRRAECGIPSNLSNPDDAAELKPCIIKLTKERIETLGGALVAAMQDRGSRDEASVVKTGATIAVAQVDAEPKIAQGGAGYEAALHTLASKLALQLQSAGQKSATVLDFTDLQGQGTELGRFLAQELSDQLVSGTKSISLVDRANLQFLLKENKLSVEGLVDPQSSRKLGNMIGIDTVIMGTVTPLGSSVRLSVRAVAVETGKIVASQSTTMPAVGGLGEMYTRGVASIATNDGQPVSPTARPSELRSRLRADSFKLTVQELAVPQGYGFARVNFTIENRSGIGVGVALRGGGTSAGPCSGEVGVSGLTTVNDQQVGQLNAAPNPGHNMRWLPPGGRVSATVTLNAVCDANTVAGVRSVPVTVTMVLGTDKELVVLPLTADRVPVRVFNPY